MQTFLPLPNFNESIKCLDDKRLGKQRVEAQQILNGNWANHPAVKMWEGYTEALILYKNLCITEWVNRGFNNNMSITPITNNIEFPYWFGCDHFHSRHRAALLYKDFDYYNQFGWIEKPEIDYWWPVERKYL